MDANGARQLRPTGIDYATDVDVVTVYDDLGRRASVTELVGTWPRTYDGNSSRVLTETDPDGSVLTYAYDACGQRNGMTLEVPAGPEPVEGDSTVVPELDYTTANGRLTAIHSSVGLQACACSYSFGSNLVQNLVANPSTGSGPGGSGTVDTLPISPTDEVAKPLPHSAPPKAKKR